ncbi:MAG: ACP phosphodiesterase [Cyanobacteria bacterium P01_F01_bin.42]
MNFLAHLYLCDCTDGSRLGALYGDFMRGCSIEQFSPEIRHGIRLHQFIDTFTDDHPVFRRSKGRIAPERRRYAGVLIDIFYDHFLALDWSDYSTQPLPQFTQSVYCLLEANADSLPERLRRIAPVLIREDWLTSYGTEAGLCRTFQGLSRRIRRENLVDQSLEDLEASRTLLHQDFCQFFPLLRAAVAQFPPLGLN